MTVEQAGGAVVVELKDRKILDEISIMQIGEQLNALVVQSEAPKMVIDFTNVAHMSSSALGVLITLHKRVREKRGKLQLCCIQSAIYEIFDISQSRQEALDSMS